MCTDETATLFPPTPNTGDDVAADRELAALGWNRRAILRSAAVLAATGTALSPATAVAAPGNGRGPAKGADDPQLTWLVGDHHVHTQYSHDAKYRIAQQLEKARQYGVDWLAFTEHANFGHANNGGVVASNREIREQRALHPDLMIFQGLEWYIPAAEHASVLVTPGPRETDLLRTFELVWDGKLNRWEKPAPGSPEEQVAERKAVEAIAWLAEQRRSGYVEDVVVLANHPLRLGIDAPHELRAWRDADRAVMIGMEGAPGAQGSGISQNTVPGDQRGEYVNSPSQYSFPGYPSDAYRPYGGFDWATATVGGVWDSLLAEGLPFWITSNSDNHLTVKDTLRTGPYPDREPYLGLPSEFDRWSVEGRRPDPVETGQPQGGSDFWPGQFSRLHTGVTEATYAGVLGAMRRGRMWVDHGHLLAGLDVRVRDLKKNGKPVKGALGLTLGSRLQVRRGSDVEVSITLSPTQYRNAAGILPRVAHVDVISGPVTGPVLDQDTLRAPQTRVTRQFDVSGSNGAITVSHVFRDVTRSFYLRVRGSDGNRTGAGYYGADVDPLGPQLHGSGTVEADPWLDTWFYANPVFVDVAT